MCRPHINHTQRGQFQQSLQQGHQCQVVPLKQQVQGLCLLFPKLVEHLGSHLHRVSGYHLQVRVYGLG
jgi:hypothetical protein